jgi:hypothetical protein
VAICCTNATDTAKKIEIKHDLQEQLNTCSSVQFSSTLLLQPLEVTSFVKIKQSSEKQQNKQKSKY